MSIIVLVGLGSASCWLLCHAYKTLPRRLDERVSESIAAFGIAVELRFPSHKGLLSRVVGLSRAVARELNLNATQLRRLELSARLRDIGMCAVSYRLVNGPTMSEWNIVERDGYFRHAEASANMLESIPELRQIAPIVRFHHTRYDGRDNACGPCGSSLPIESRILQAVCDYVWFERHEGNASAYHKLSDGSGGAYCPAVVDALLSVIPSVRSAHRTAVLV